jgi:hypothetical protein
MLRCKFRAAESGVECIRCRRFVKTVWTPDKVRAMCGGWPLPDEWGHWLAFVFAAAGLRKQTWNWLRRQLGFVEPCKCADREAWLNSFGGRVVTGWRRLRGRSTEPPSH